MNTVDHISNLGHLVSEIEITIARQQYSRELLIRESFIVWHLLSETGHCEVYSEKDLLRLLKRNFEIYQQRFVHDTDYSFITGWMMQAAFWHFRTSLDESYGSALLLHAHQQAPYNSLFKWAVRQELRLPAREVARLQMDIRDRFEEHYNYGPVIRNYFLGLMVAYQ